MPDPACALRIHRIPSTALWLRKSDALPMVGCVNRLHGWIEMKSATCPFRLLVFMVLLVFIIYSTPPGSFGRQVSPGQDAYSNLYDPRLVPLLRSLADEPDMNDLSPREGRHLYDLIVRSGLTAGLVIGRGNGYAAVWAAMAFRRTGGRMIAVGESKDHVRLVTANLRKAGLLDGVEIREGTDAAALSGLAGPFDFVFFDGAPQDYSGFLAVLLPAVRPGGYIAAHDVSSRSREAADYIRKVTGSPSLKTELLAISPAGLSVTQKLFPRDF